jgi:hypothetical protein
MALLACFWWGFDLYAPIAAQRAAARGLGRRGVISARVSPKEHDWRCWTRAGWSPAVGRSRRSGWPAVRQRPSAWRGRLLPSQL